MKKARYFITCNELPDKTIHELTPLGVKVTCSEAKETYGRPSAYTQF